MNNIGMRFDSKADQAFTTAVRAAVSAYFKENSISMKADRATWVKALIMLAAVIVPYGLILSGQLSIWGMWLCCAALGFGIAGYGFSVMHDALHGTFSRHPAVNAALGVMIDLVGASGFLWKLRHNTMHHTYTNIYGADVDLDASWIIRFSPHAEYYPVQRFQHIYAYLLYSITSLHWIIVKDYRSISLRSHGPYRDVEHPRWRVASVIGLKLLYYFNFIALPLILLDITILQWLVGFLTLHLINGFLLSMTFQISHLVDKTEHFEAEPGRLLEHSWLVHELKVTSNFACENRLVTWLVGGLNHQIEHHLFPHINSAHYPALRPIIKEITARHGLPYHEHKTVTEALQAHHRLLIELGAPPRAEKIAV